MCRKYLVFLDVYSKTVPDMTTKAEIVSFKDECHLK